MNNETTPSQLLEYSTRQLGNIVLRTHLNFISKTVEDALKIAVLKSIVVIPVSLCVLRPDLAAIRQNPDEPFRTFAARVQDKAETC